MTDIAIAKSHGEEAESQFRQAIRNPGYRRRKNHPQCYPDAVVNGGADGGGFYGSSAKSSRSCTGSELFVGLDGLTY